MTHCGQHGFYWEEGDAMGCPICYAESTVKPTEISFTDWLQLGLTKGWCGPAVCYTHDGLPTSAEEDDELEESDPCMHIIRLYEDKASKLAIEENHGPSTWRASNSGLDL